ncbi:hypothetical protein SI82_07910 [Streptococcus iniae]|uniref:Uncharacterized protein n=1 Tax=Streptococcus iniae TaxID=1346 RepID=A0ABN4D9I3_STRIN|nr:hypothetical protein DQ08_07795 [Streptococcus iniae]AHY18210.1 hypothetical protein DW64_07780 [Streptococcus iniae]AJG26496.1 hypothetical protein SI82_07910 [Streptococcus iniae]
MLALAVMPVVFVLGEKISLGMYFSTLRRVKWLSPLICQSKSESATVTQFLWKRKKWNAVNPSS